MTITKKENIKLLMNATNYILKYLEYRIEIEKKYDEEEKELQFSLSNAIPKNSSLEQLCYIFRLSEFECNILLPKNWV